MKESRNHGSNFEERLLDELKAVVARRGAEQTASTKTVAHSPACRRAPRLTAGAAAVLAAAAAVFIFNSGNDNTSRAFAVEQQDGGGETIKILSPEDAAGLEGALAEAGIRSQVTWLPAGMTCREPRFTESTAKTPAGGSIGAMGGAGPGKAMTIGVMTSQEWHERRREYMRGEISESDFFSGNITLEPASFRPDQTVVISGSRGPYDGNPEGGSEIRMGIAEGPVEPCEPVKVPDGGVLEDMNRTLESESAPSSEAE